MFSQKDFIDVSRDFVCVRLESYESEEHQDMVRSFLGGRFENTAFCILAPDGKTRLSGTGRGPSMALRIGAARDDDEAQLAGAIAAMKRIAKDYPEKNRNGSPVVQDFHTFRQALNVASGDQRLLLFVAAPEKAQPELRETLGPVLGDPKIIGLFHTDFAGGKEDANWADSVTGAKGKTGFFVIQSDQFGQEGKVVARIPLDAEATEIRSTLTKANDAFAGSEDRKVYSDHVAQGRREGIHFEGGMPYGEDRDGDGEIDHGGPGPGGDSRRMRGRGRGQEAQEPGFRPRRGRVPRPTT